MRTLVISDIHGNLEALDAVLAAAGPVGHVLVLGDVVGYGADPNACIDRVRAFPSATVIRGNHDKVAAGIEPSTGFNHLARIAIAWTTAALRPDNAAWLAALPQGPVIVDAGTEICHGTPFDEDVYVFGDGDARRALRAARRPLCLYGHTHVPAIYTLDDRLSLTTPHGAHVVLPLGDEARYLVNCGSVGQPRDGDPHAAFGVIDSDRRELVIERTDYDRTAAQAKMLAAHLPDALVWRLDRGQ